MERAKAAGVPLIPLGATGGAVISLSGEQPLRVANLKQRFEAWLPAYMARSH
jgi:phosphoribosylformylglycinamidine synthase